MFKVKSNAVRTGIESVKIPCRNGLTFTEGNQLIFDVPRELGFGQLKDAFIECDINLNGSDNAPAVQLYRNCGASSIIERCTIRADTGQVIEQLDNYNLYTNLRYLASEDLGILDKRSRIEGCAKSYKPQDNPYITQNKATASNTALTNVNDTWRFVDRKVQIPLNSSGVFNNNQVHPCLAVPLQVNLLLEKNKRCMFLDPNLATLNCVNVPAGAQDYLTISPADQLKFGIKGSGNEAPTDPLLNKMANFPYRVGQRVKVTASAGTTANLVNGGNFTILEVQLDGNGDLNVKFQAAINTGALNDVELHALNNGLLMTDSPSAGGHTTAPQTINYQVKNPRLVVPKVIPAPQYTAAIAKAIAKGKYGMDIVSYIDYQNAIPGSVTNSTTIIPADLSRCKSLLSVPTEQIDLDRLDRLNNVIGKYMGAQSYEYQINNVLRPSRLVDLHREAFGEFNIGQDNFIGNPDYENPSCLGGVHLYEVEKALGDAGIPIRNLGFLGKTNNVNVQNGSWLTGRSLGPYGMSENLMGVSAIQYLNYDGSNANLKLLHSFVVHIRTIAISPQGIEIRY